MKRIGLAILALAIYAMPATAEQWSKTYTISNAPDLRIETSDANIHVDTWDQKTIQGGWPTSNQHYLVPSNEL